MRDYDRKARERRAAVAQAAEQAKAEKVDSGVGMAG
jgi:hypothetical protein